MLHSPVVNFHYCAVRYNDQCRPVNDQYLDVVKDTQEVGAKEVHGESAEATNGGNITIMAGMAGFFYVAGYLIEERRRWPVITASTQDNLLNKARIRRKSICLMSCT